MLIQPQLSVVVCSSADRLSFVFSNLLWWETQFFKWHCFPCSIEHLEDLGIPNGH